MTENNNACILIFLFLIMILAGCGSQHIDVMPEVGGNSLKVDVNWPGRQVDGVNYAPPSHLNISTVEILLIDVEEYNSMQDASTSEVDLFHIGKDMNSRYYEFDVKEGSPHRDGAEITEIPAAEYAFFFMPRDIDGEYPFFYVASVMISEDVPTYINIDYDDWEIEIPLNGATPVISSRSADALEISWYDNGTNDSYNIYVDGSLYNSYNSDGSGSDGFLSLDITGLDNGQSVEVRLDSIKDGAIVENATVGGRTKYFTDTQLESAIIDALNNILSANEQLSSENDLTDDILAHPSFTSFSYDPRSGNPVPDGPKRASGGGAISDLTGLEFCSVLSAISLPGNNISDLSVLALLENLNQLDISENSITDLSPLAVLSSITSLDLDGNSITTLPDLSLLTSLTSISLSGNGLTDISALSSLSNLQSVDLSGNSITDVSALLSLSNLSSVSLNGNPDELDLSGLAAAGIASDITYESTVGAVSVSVEESILDIGFSVKYIPDDSVHIVFIMSDNSEVEYPSAGVETNITDTTGAKNLSVDTSSIAEFADVLNEDVVVRVIPHSLYSEMRNYADSQSFTVDNRPHPPAITIDSVDQQGRYATIAYTVNDIKDPTCEVGVQIFYDEDYESVASHAISGDLGQISNGVSNSVVVDLGVYYRGMGESLPLKIVTDDNRGFTDYEEVEIGEYNGFILKQIATVLDEVFYSMIDFNNSGDLCILYQDMEGIHYVKYAAADLNSEPADPMEPDIMQPIIDTTIEGGFEDISDFVMFGDNPVFSLKGCQDIIYSSDGGLTFDTLTLDDTTVNTGFGTSSFMSGDIPLASDDQYVYIGISANPDPDPVNDEYDDFFIVRFDGTDLTTELAVHNDDSFDYGENFCEAPVRMAVLDNGDLQFNALSSYRFSTFHFEQSGGVWPEYGSEFSSFYSMDYPILTSGNDAYTVGINGDSQAFVVYESTTQKEWVDLAQYDFEGLCAPGMTKVYDGSGYYQYPGLFFTEQGIDSVNVSFLYKPFGKTDYIKSNILEGREIVSNSASYNGRMAVLLNGADAQLPAPRRGGPIPLGGGGFVLIEK